MLFALADFSFLLFFQEESESDENLSPRSFRN